MLYSRKKWMKVQKIFFKKTEYMYVLRGQNPMDNVDNHLKIFDKI